MADIPHNDAGISHLHSILYVPCQTGLTRTDGLYCPFFVSILLQECEPVFRILSSASLIDGRRGILNSGTVRCVRRDLDHSVVGFLDSFGYDRRGP